ncbi:1,4-dihydroxy-2-naphthoate polyprenyltransferase [Opitutus terrae]|uniref:1,4-dihydroxy-2-naphthoate octaprenyltransferase n=1 Tax=Opitutus terrae (strain DSM 11246 / JCM 15787 / PB90-1) TaxID=452637 RepID=B1ZZ52_OPITP|nr:1,4-dihydroxy-2-naphthoate polyprenyltransferase [Opitutus terrae]ACB77124.1 1,4-dihydroxy-2-naphthoate octaprenyltransferase [Opitutus terrae PB90-1]
MKPSFWHIWISAARPRTLPAAIAPVIVGSALAWRDDVFEPAAAALCLGFALLVQIGTNFANDYYDFMRGADTAARVGPQRAVAAGWVSPATMRRAMWATFATAFACGLGLLLWGGPWLILIGLASILCGIAYTGGPWPLAYHGLGDVFVFIFFGLVAVGATYFVQAGAIYPDVLLAAVPIGLLATNILVVNNYRDVETDAAAGKRTLVVRWGRRAARLQHAGSLLIALLVPGWFCWTEGTLWRLLPLAILPLAGSHVRRLRAAQTPVELIALLVDTGKLLALYALLAGASFVTG